jgi:hypothetical protein
VPATLWADRLEQLTSMGSFVLELAASDMLKGMGTKVISNHIQSRRSMLLLLVAYIYLSSMIDSLVFLAIHVIM